MAAIGQVLVLATAGFATDPALVRRWSRRAPAIALGSLLVPLAAGAVLGVALPIGFRGVHATAGTFALFMAIALAISSPPVISRVLADTGLLRRDFGQVTLAVAMGNDVVGWVLLSVVASLAVSSGLPAQRLAVAVGTLTIFIAVAWRWGVPATNAVLARVRRGGHPHGALAFGLVAIFATSALTNAAGIEAVLGAFVAGLVLRQARGAKADIEGPITSVTDAWFAPLFFAVAGLRVDLGALAHLDVLGWAIVAVAVASAAKLVGVFSTARLSGSSATEAAALAVGLNIRGSLEIVLATTGLALGVLNVTSYTVVLVVAVATSAMAAPLLRRITRDWDGDLEERRRIGQERLLAATTSLPDRTSVPAVGLPEPARAVARAIWWSEPTAEGQDRGAVVVTADESLGLAVPWLVDGRSTVLLVAPTTTLPTGDDRRAVIVAVSSTATAAVAVEAAAAIALATGATLRLVHLRRHGRPAHGVRAADRWASAAGVPAETVIVDQSAELVTVADAVRHAAGPDDLVVVGTTAHVEDGEVRLGGCAATLLATGTPLVMVVPPAAGIFATGAGWT